MTAHNLVLATLTAPPRVRRSARARAEAAREPFEGRGTTIRFAYPDDELALGRLAALDDAPRPRGPVLIAEVGGELWAAASLDGKVGIADPFRPSGELLAMLRERARILQRRYR